MMPHQKSFCLLMAVAAEAEAILQTTQEQVEAVAELEVQGRVVLPQLP